MRSADRVAGTPDRTPDGGTDRGFSSLRPFRHRSFTLLWTAGLISTVGSWMQTVAVGALVISDTGSATWAVLVAAGGFLPIGLLSPIGGALADRLPRRPVLAIGNLAAAVTAALIAILVSGGHDNPGALVALVTLQGSASALIGPFQQAILPDLVPKREFLAAASLNSAEWNLGRIGGPALAGITVAAFGYSVAFVANAVSFLAVVVALAFVKFSPPSGKRTSLLPSLREGFTAARREPSCWAAIVTIAVVALLASPFIALVPVMAHHLTHGGARAVAQTTALLTTAQGAGAVLGALCLTPLAGRIGRGRLLAWNLAVLPAVLVGYGASQTRWQGVILLFIVGLVYIGVLSGLTTLVQLRAPQAYRGRVLSFFLVALGVAYPIGSLVQGPVIDWVGLGWTTAGTAALLSLIMAAVALRNRAFVRAITGGMSAEPPDFLERDAPPNSPQVSLLSRASVRHGRDRAAGRGVRRPRQRRGPGYWRLPAAQQRRAGSWRA